MKIDLTIECIILGLFLMAAASMLDINVNINVYDSKGTIVEKVTAP